MNQGDTIMSIGKYKGMKYNQIIKDHSDYIEQLRWSSIDMGILAPPR
jgi:hypothetical protein